MNKIDASVNIGTHKPNSILEFKKRWIFWLALAAFVFLGFGIRSAFVMHGYDSFNSDEAFTGESLIGLTNNTVRSDFICDLDLFRGPRYVIGWCESLLSGKRPEIIPFFSCFINVLFYLAWAFVLVRRTRAGWKSALPIILFMAIPTPCISYLGIQNSEMRSFYFYGPLFILGAGLWLKNGFGALVFGFLAVKSCLDDPFSFFFIWPVLIYEAQTAKNVLFKGYLKKTILFLAGCLGGTILGLVHDPWVLRKQTNYLHFGIAPFSQWAAHLKMLLEAWPLYWISALPWGYLQNSRLGLWLHPRSVNWIDGCVPIVFWILFLAVGIGSYFFCQKNFHERLLWWGPFGSFLAFFIFSQQTWDAMTLRYLGFGQMVLGIWLGLWAADASKHRWGKLWIVFLSLWIGFNAFFIARNLSGPARIHPGAYISERLEQLGIKAGFANYWVSETVRYFSQDQILIEPYNHSPISRKTLEAAQNSPKIGLIWLDGLDRPSAFPEIEKQLRSLNYRPAGRINFPREGWRIFVWKKAHCPPVKSTTTVPTKNHIHPPKDQT